MVGLVANTAVSLTSAWFAIMSVRQTILTVFVQRHLSHAVQRIHA